MNFLDDNQICAWAEEHGLQRGQGSQVSLPALPSVYRREYANGRRSGDERSAVEDLIKRLGPWEECLVLITEWGVWPSGEDWPAFYAWRGALGERRSIEVASGHRFDHDEADLLLQLLTMITQNAWDADILWSKDGRATGTRGKISHDEWYEVLRDPDCP